MTELPYGWAFDKSSGQSVVTRLDVCPEDLLIDGVAPSNWRRHQSALLLEAKALHAANEPALLALLASGDWQAIQRSPLVGVSDIQKVSKRYNKIKGLQACLRKGRAKGHGRVSS